jgi:hydrogenase maturation protease
MTPGCPESGRAGNSVPKDRGRVAPVLVLAVGNILLGDDGVGQRLLSELGALAGRWGGAVELVDGGTQGMALLGFLTGRRAVVLLDAVAVGAAPGAVHRLHDQAVFAAAPRAGMTTHEASAVELLRAAALVGELPDEVVVVGVEPANLETGVGLSQVVEANIPDALRAAVAAVDALVSQASRGRSGGG